MGNLPRLELTEEKSTLKNNDYIIFRKHFKGKKIKSEKEKKLKTKKTKTKKTKTKTKSRKKRKTRSKGFLNIF